LNISGKWLDKEQSIYLYKFLGLWTWADYDNCCHQHKELLDDQNSIVHLILDMSATQYIPPGARLWAQRPAQLTHENKGMTILVSANDYMRSLIRMYRINPAQDDKHVTICKTMDEALSYLQKNTGAESS
jgi:hypothetical protein